MAPRTKLRQTDINNAQIIDALIGSREIETPTPVSEESTSFNSLTDFMQHTANRLKYVQENGGGSVTGSGFTAIELKNITILTTDWNVNWWGGGYNVEIHNTNIDANSIVEVIPSVLDAETIQDANISHRIESHNGYVTLFADAQPTDDLIVTINIFKQVLNENEYLIEDYKVQVGPTTFLYGYVLLEANDLSEQTYWGTISPIMPSESTLPYGSSSHFKYFCYYKTGGTIEVSGNVLSVEVNGVVYDTVNSYNATYNYTILAAPTNPFSSAPATGILADEAILVKIIFNE